MFLGIMQPYFFPHLGYFQLISASDKWIVFDVVQYNPKSWMSRNRILHPDRGWQYINIPVIKSPHGTAIKEISTVNPLTALTKIIGQVDHYKKRAPFFDQVIELINKGFINAPSTRLVDLNISTLAVFCDYLKIDFVWSLCSELNLELDSVDSAGQWALRISEQLGATDYINPAGGENLFNPEDWSKSGIRLHIYEPPDFKYACGAYQYEKNLSIIDVLMWNDPDKIRNILSMTHARRIYEPVGERG